jgi:hypothetical protein
MIRMDNEVTHPHQTHACTALPVQVCIPDDTLIQFSTALPMLLILFISVSLTSRAFPSATAF